MKVSVVGTGYVGLVTGSCLADSGHEVLCIDADPVKVGRLREGHIPIYEPGLESIVVSNVEAGRLRFSLSAEEAVEFGEIIVIAVGTPPDEDGSADLRHVLAVARSIGQHIQDYRVVVDKSTVPVGTADRVEAAIREVLAERGIAVPFSVVSNPEFLKEGAAVEDFMRPDRIVLGVEDPPAEERMRELYAPFQRNHDRIVVMSRRSAELTKYAANAMLATRISFMNELANLADRLGADIEDVRRGIGSDPRIGYSFLYAGTGYGGSCFPKDVSALLRTASTEGQELLLLQAVETVNAAQKKLLVEMAREHMGSLAGKRVAVWGLAFKPNTDDMREAPSRVVLEGLWAEGAVVAAYDPAAADECRRIYGERDDLILAASPLEAVRGADALFILTEWKEFRAPAFDEIHRRMNRPLVFDGRNLYDPRAMRRRGFEYRGIGRR
ncbi:MAG: UDP-glucose/GDP-mannose dehydrogenase family protein [Gemmatimonadales bacterium]|nr:UDP-glucose/GDP-mannose dehydrogenase family protein [Gemmatimonadales bacterium]